MLSSCCICRLAPAVSHLPSSTLHLYFFYDFHVLQDSTKMAWVFDSLHDQWEFGRFDAESLSLRGISGRAELKGIGYVDICLCKMGLRSWLANKKMDDYIKWPSEQKLVITSACQTHQSFRLKCGFSADPTKPNAVVDLTWLGAMGKSLAKFHAFIEARACM